jgi:hypothetical protein
MCRLVPDAGAQIFGRETAYRATAFSSRIVVFAPYRLTSDIRRSAQKLLHGGSARAPDRTGRSARAKPTANALSSRAGQPGPRGAVTGSRPSC